MKVEAWIFGLTTGFFVLVTPAYWFITGANLGESDWTGHRRAGDDHPAGRHDHALPRLPRQQDGAAARGPRPRPRSPRVPVSWGSSRRTRGGRCGVRCAPRPCVYGIAVGAWWLVIIGGRAGLRRAVRLGVRVLPRRVRPLTQRPPRPVTRRRGRFRVWRGRRLRWPGTDATSSGGSHACPHASSGRRATGRSGSPLAALVLLAGAALSGCEAQRGGPGRRPATVAERRPRRARASEPGRVTTNLGTKTRERCRSPPSSR